MNIDPYICAYLDHLVERSLAIRTIKGYRQELDLFSRFIDGVLLAEGLHAQVLDYLARPRPDGQPIKPGSRNRKLVVLRGFFAHLVKTGALESSPAHSVSWSRLSRHERPFVTMDDYRAVLAVLAREKPSWRRARDRTIIKTLFHAGLRVSELLELTVDQVDLEAGLLNGFRRKGGSIQTLPVNSTLGIELAAWLQARDSRKPKTDHLIISRTGGPLCVRQVERKMKALGQAAGVTIPMTPHAVRHLHASQLVGKQVNLEVVRCLLNHRSITTTTRYTHVSFDTLREALELLSSNGA